MAEWDVLKVQADTLEVKIVRKWKTSIVALGVGEQRQNKVSRPLVDMSLSFKNPYSENDVDELTAFFDKMKGAHSAFIVPSWKKDGRSTLSYTADVTTVSVSHPLRFTMSVSSISNFLVLGTLLSSSPFTWQMETSRINSIVGNILHISTPFAFAYPSNSYVYQGYKVRFADDELPRTIFVGEAYQSQDVDFTGVY